MVTARLDQASTEGAIAWRDGMGVSACPYVERSTVPWIESEAALREAWLQGYRFAARVDLANG